MFCRGVNVFVFCFASELFDQRAQQDVVDVGVAENLAGSRLQRHGERAVNAFGFVGSVQAPRVCEVDVYRFAGRVRQQHANGDPLPLRSLAALKSGK